jgi:hypothetical protein
MAKICRRILQIEPIDSENLPADPATQKVGELSSTDGIHHQIAQRRPRSRAARALAVETGVRRSALRSNRVNASRPAGSFIGRLSRYASARAARRTKELRVSPVLRAAASMIRRSVSGRETRTLRIPIVYLRICESVPLRAFAYDRRSQEVVISGALDCISHALT